MIGRTLEEFRRREQVMLPGSRVLCACSGGTDSTALLAALCHAPGLTVLCAHYNHGLRGEESDRDEEFVRELCVRLGVEFHAGRGDVADYAEKHALGIEAAARTLRYAFLEERAQALRCDWIATAHNAEDNAETVLMNLIRGSGARGLGGIPPVRGKIVRPLLTLRRSELARYLDERGLPHVEDSSNRSDDYTRNRIRHTILPLLLEENPAAVENIGTAAALLRADEKCLSAEANAFLAAYDAEAGLDIPALLALPESIGSRVLHRLGGGGKAHTDALYALCCSGEVHGTVNLPGLRVQREYDRLSFAPVPCVPIERRELKPGVTELPEAGTKIICSFDAKSSEIHNSFNTFFFNREKICGRIFVASRAPGDRVRLLGRGCTKTLKKLFSEASMPLNRRLSTAVLYDEAGVIAVEGFGIAERCAAVPGDPVIRAELQKL